MRTKHIRLISLILALMLAPAGAVLAHGVHAKVTQQYGMQIYAVYDGGEPMSYAAVEIFHENAELPFQKGRTDKNGYFLFKPDKPGNWEITVKDGMGHQLSANTSVGKDLVLKKKTAADKRHDALSRPEKVLMGIAIIFGLSGFFFWWRGRRQQQSCPAGPENKQG
ncbi:MAG: hypothetical protein R6X08_08825 [Desulfosalsimonadaceae bacterium]